MIYIVQYNNKVLVIHYDNNTLCYSDREDVRVFAGTHGDLHMLLALSSKVTRKEIETIIIDPLLVNYKLKYCYSLFAGFTDLKRIIGLEYLNTSEVDNMSRMFAECKSLTSIDVSNFNTSNVMDMSKMFSNCANLKTIYAGAGWIIGKDTDSEGMFENSTKLVGGKGTIFSPDATDASRAKIDGGKANPGYFTAK